MTMTENEAKTKWCPQVRAINEDFENDQASNRTEQAEAPSGWDCPAYLCIASACMAWRWKLNDHGHSMNLGWCGLAGAP